jgi:uncharacterized protein YbbK (DUF523 family)
MKVIVSECLATGHKCRYSGTDAPNPKVDALVESGEVILVCPEILAGLSTPRDPAEIKNGRVVTEKGEDLTDNFTKGARLVLEICQKHNVSEAILKSKSPSCGSGKTYDGSFSNMLVDGDGITAALLKENGINVISSDEITR